MVLYARTCEHEELNVTKLLVTVTLALLAAAGSAKAAIIGSHLGNANPVDEGWTYYTFGGGVAVGGVSGDRGRDAWYVDDNGSFVGAAAHYDRDATDEELNNAFNYGWRLDLRVRVADNSGGASVLAWFEDRLRGKVYPLMIIGEEGVTGITVELGGNDHILPLLSDDYHLYQLISPGGGIADLWVDGVQVLTGFSGIASSYPHSMGFGSGDSMNTGMGLYNEFRVQVGEPQVNAVPEPHSLAALMLIGLTVVAGRRWRGRRQRNPGSRA
jgi:hypothetical protein